MDKEVSAGRLARLKSELASDGLDGFYVRDTSNIAWLTAFDDVFDSEAAHAVWVDESCAQLHTDSRYSAACRVAAGEGPWEIDDAPDANGRGKTHARWLSERAHGTVGIEDAITLAEFRALEGCLPEEGWCLSETSAYVNGLRAVKDAEEIARLRAAQAITDAAFAHIVGFIKPGMSEREVQIELEDYMIRHGASGLAFPSIVATGANGASPHAIPGDDRLEAGQCVVMDFGARAQGYCSDMTRMVFIGQPDRRLSAAYEVLRDANEQVERMLAPGVTGAQAHSLAEQVLAEGGFANKMGHGLGHGVGIDIHEAPTLSLRNTSELQVGNVVTVEPGIYLEGQFGMRLEDFGVITEEGFDVFTRSTHEMVII